MAETISNSEKVYKEMISSCESRISQLSSGFVNSDSFYENSEESFNFSLNLVPGKEISRQELIDAKAQLGKCRDKDLLGALRDEFYRQLRLQETKRLASSNPPPPQISPTPTQHNYFQSPDQNRYCHFETQKIVRELILGGGTGAKLLLAGRDDNEMCQWNLEEARIAEELGDEITEKEFNTVWFHHGGFPYVRPMRKIRRFLSSAMIKKPC